MTRLNLSLWSGVLFLLSSSTQAAVSPLGVSIFPPVQFPPADFTITGARLNVLWGAHQKVYGLDFGGLGNLTTQDIGGVQVAGLINYNKGTSHIAVLQFAGVANINVNKATVIGVQASLFNSNQAESVVGGLQIAGVNLEPFTTVMGVSAGIYNYAKTVYGLQVGLINRADDLHGVQIGLVNFHTHGLFAVAPILNVGF